MARAQKLANQGIDLTLASRSGMIALNDQAVDIASSHKKIASARKLPHSLNRPVAEVV